jgi:type I restriction enzyme S subunit
MASGTTFKELSGAVFSQLPVPVPPLNEQLRIVAKIEELFSELDKGIESLKIAREQIKVYRQALLKHAFEGKLPVKRGAMKRPYENPKVHLAEVVESLGQGWSPSCLNHPSMDSDTWGIIKTSAIQAMDFLEYENKQLPTNLEPRRIWKYCQEMF